MVNHRVTVYRRLVIFFLIVGLMLTIKVGLFTLRLQDQVIGLPDNAQVSDVLEYFELLERKDIIAVVNGRRCEMDYPLKDGDVVAFFPIIMGG